MRTISNAVGRGPICETSILDSKGRPIEGWSIREPVKSPPKRERIVDNFGFITNCYPRCDGSKLGVALRLGDPTPLAANDNVQPHRWPVVEEYLAGRLGTTAAENELAWQAVMYIADAWNSFCTEAEPYLCPGTAHHNGESVEPNLGDLSRLRGAEIVADFYGRWRRVNSRTNGGFYVVKKAIVDGAEMRDLAPDVANLAKRAAVGRARLIAALPIVAEEVSLLERADAA